MSTEDAPSTPQAPPPSSDPTPAAAPETPAEGDSSSAGPRSKDQRRAAAERVLVRKAASEPSGAESSAETAAPPPSAAALAAERSSLEQIRERMAAARAGRERQLREERAEARAKEAEARAEKAERDQQDRRRYLTADDIADPKRLHEAGVDTRKTLDALLQRTLHPDKSEQEERIAALERKHQEDLEARDKRIAAIEQQRQAEEQERYWNNETEHFLNAIKQLDIAKGLPDDFLVERGVDAVAELLQNAGTYDRALAVELAAAKLANLRKVFVPAPQAAVGTQLNSPPQSGIGTPQAQTGRAPAAPPRTLTADLETQSTGAPRKRSREERKAGMVARLAREQLERDAKH